jgi:hypothetical protein
MLAQHAALVAAISDIKKALPRWRADPTPANGEALAATLDPIVPLMVEHTRDEEQRALSLIETYVTAAEYSDAIANIVRGLLPADLPVIMGMLIYEGGIEMVPPAVRDEVREVAPRAYAEHYRRVHKTALPPRGTSY